jgi:alkanesulfonate monooxygenase SsuD/methylene tetrahydromethanopterin reductase-like flavin-dependent oxidoreductase (luciferase family)
LTGPRTLANYVVPTLRAAAEDAGRQAEVVAALPICVTDDPAKARQTAAKTYAIYGTLPSYRACWTEKGRTAPWTSRSSGTNRR